MNYAFHLSFKKERILGEYLKKYGKPAQTAIIPKLPKIPNALSLFILHTPKKII
jgi:hypothetical protein